MNASREKLTVEVWMDLICPYCWIGLTRLKKALAGFEQSGEVKVVHRAYRLLKDADPEPSEKLIAQKFGSTDKARARLRDLEQAAAAEGLTYKLDGTRLGDTAAAHRLIKLASDRGRGPETIERLFRGFYSERASIFDEAGLASLATDAGLSGDEVADVLRSDTYRKDIEADEARFRELGGQSTPFFVICGKTLPPSQTVERLVEALSAAWADRHPTTEHAR